MTRRRIFLAAASFALSAVLILALVKLSRIDVEAMLQQLKSIRLPCFIRLVLLNVVLVVVSTEKWRSIDVALRRSSDAAQPRTTSFALTSIGLAIGTFLPVQLAMSAARSLGTYFHGSAVKRGTLGTLYEQGFDLLTAALLAAATLVAHFEKGGTGIWLTTAGLLIIGLLIAVKPLVQRGQGIVAFAAEAIPAGSRAGRIARKFSEHIHSELLNIRLARRLILLSVARFAIIVLMSMQSAAAVGLNISAWHFAMAIPFIVMASVLALTPGGLGINEWTGAAALSFCGTLLQTAAAWALAHRVLVTISYLIVAVVGSMVALAGKLPAFRLGRIVEEH